MPQQLLVSRESSQIARSVAAALRRAIVRATILGACVFLLGAYYPPGVSDGTRNPARAFVRGIYPGSDPGSCCWLSDRAVWKIAPPAEAVTAIVTVFVPDYAPFRSALESLDVQIGNGPAAHACCYRSGIHQFPVRLPVHTAGAVLTVRATSRVSFVPRALGLNGDPRRLSVLLRGMEFRAADGTTVAATPIVASDNRLGSVLYGLLALAVLIVTRIRPSWGLAALIVIEPLGKEYPIWHTTITPFKVALVGALVGLLFRSAWLGLLRDRRALVLLASILSIAFATGLSGAHAIYREPVLRETFKALEYALAFVVAYVALRADPIPATARNAFAISSVVVCIAALAQEVIGAPEGVFVGGHAISRIAGPLEGPNQLGSWLGIVAPILLAFFAQAWAIGALAVLTELLTFSLGGAIGMVAAIVAVFARSMRAGVTLGAAIVGGLAILTLRFGFQGRAGEIDTYNGGLGTRADLWHAAFVMFRAYPLTGIGAGNYELLLGQYGLPGVRTHANSWYLQGMAEGGILMLLAIAFVVVATIATFARCHDGFGLAAFAASFGLCLHQIVDDVIFYPKVGAMWWLLLGIAAASLTFPAELLADQRLADRPPPHDREE